MVTQPACLIQNIIRSKYRHSKAQNNALMPLKTDIRLALIESFFSAPLWTMGPACPYTSSRSSVKPVNLEHILIKSIRIVDFVPAAPSRQSKAQPHAQAAKQASSPSEDRQRAIFVASAPTLLKRNQERARSAPQGSMQEIQGPQLAIQFPIALQDPGQKPDSLSWTPCAPLIRHITTRQSKNLSVLCLPVLVLI